MNKNDQKEFNLTAMIMDFFFCTKTLKRFRLDKGSVRATTATGCSWKGTVVSLWGGM